VRNAQREVKREERLKTDAKFEALTACEVEKEERAVS